VCLPEPPRENGGIGISHLADEIRNTKKSSHGEMERERPGG